MKEIGLEVCCGDIASVIAAHKGGAKRIELCSGLAEGGLTPSLGLIKGAVAIGIPEINVLIRPRSGDFLYTPEEIEVMKEDVRLALEAGATGVVVGALTPEGDIDVAAVSALVETARATRPENLNLTFHRAFDLSRDMNASLDVVIKMGFDCLLTSGMASSALKGIPVLKKLVERSDGKVLIMAGSGVNPANAGDIVKITGVGAVHSTARKPIASKMKFRRVDVPMGAPGSNEYAPLATSPDVVMAIRRSIGQKVD